jgi:hypothetical protein
MPPFIPTEEQQAIVSAALTRSESLLVRAFAGCAKTTTLELIANALPKGPVLALAFNVKIKKELESRFPKHCSVLTLNGLGHRAWSHAIGKRLTLDTKKLGRLTSSAFAAAGFSQGKDDWGVVKTLAEKAMQLGLIPNSFSQKGLISDTRETWEDISFDEGLQASPAHLSFAREVLSASILEGAAGVISFDDQIYLSALFGGAFPRFPIVMVDESQDLSPLNHIQIRRSCAGRLIVVGDEKQAIYAFRGADFESIAKLRALRSDWLELPLATTFRCPKTVVARQQSHVPSFRAWEGCKEGQVVTLGEDWNWSDITTFGGSIAVLCRNNAPLVSFAFKLLSSGVGCVMLGRDIGKGLERLSRKLTPDDNESIESTLRSVRTWQEHECALALANGNDSKLEKITDQAACLIAVASKSTPTAGALRLRLSALFARDSGLVTLSTGHRAKGLEWDTVLHLDPQRVPSRFARSPTALTQEMNLLYVIETRTKSTLINAKLEDFSA